MEPVSDHFLMIASVVTSSPRDNRPFKFLNMWLQHPSFDIILDSCWKQYVNGSAQFVLATKLKSLKHPLKELNTCAFGSIAQRSTSANLEFKKAIKAHMDDPLNDELKSEVSVLRAKANFLLESERHYLQQKAQHTHLVESDRSSKYFHSMIKRNNVKNSISYLVKEDGTTTSSHEESPLINLHPSRIPSQVIFRSGVIILSRMRANWN
ncbi:hypothetical protein RND71_034583 [Anisodus tanguticus]|uniref:Uncharacterized protein n=1 Tax=Anisodus tanguticus TaxID=243964 RepID=A0AAE1RBJ7_9SOLA|nr:hypothetical protein RND71_034583 [Anisodus tanguticus]